MKRKLRTYFLAGLLVLGCLSEAVAMQHPFASEYLAATWKRWLVRQKSPVALPQAPPEALVSRLVSPACGSELELHWHDGKIVAVRQTIPGEALLQTPEQMELAWISGHLLYRLSARDAAAAKDLLFEYRGTMLRNGLTLSAEQAMESGSCFKVRAFQVQDEGSKRSINLHFEQEKPLTLRFEGKRWPALPDVFRLTDSLVASLKRFDFQPFKVPAPELPARIFKDSAGITLPPFPGFQGVPVSFFRENQTWRLLKPLRSVELALIQHQFPVEFRRPVPLPDTIIVDLNTKPRQSIVIAGENRVSAFFDTFVHPASVNLRAGSGVVPAVLFRTNQDWYHFWMVKEQQSNVWMVQWYPFIPKVN
jgi:hypothetical protein